MKTILISSVVAIVVLSSFVVAQPPHKSKEEAQKMEQKVALPQPDKVADDAFAVLLASIEDNNYAGMISKVDDNFKVALTKDVFEKVSAQMAPRLKADYESTYLGSLRKQGYTVYLWKLQFKDGGDDVLAELSLKDSKVAGFFLR